MALHLLDDLNEALVTRTLGKEQRLELVGIVGKRLGRLRHGWSKTYFLSGRDALESP
jgi:hypothetical protein